MDSTMLVFVTLAESQSTKKTPKHLTLKNNCDTFWSQSSSDLGMNIRGLEVKSVA